MRARPRSPDSYSGAAGYGIVLELTVLRAAWKFNGDAWVGLIALGYAFGRIMTMPGPARNRWCVRIGVMATLAFLVLRGFNVDGDPGPWNPTPPGAVSPLAPLFSFLNTVKLPASLLFLLMTLGPSIMALPLLERWRGGIGRALEVFGRVPLFYYVLHIPAIHVAAVLVSLLRTGVVSPWLFAIRWSLVHRRRTPSGACRFCISSPRWS